MGLPQEFWKRGRATSHVGCSNIDELVGSLKPNRILVDSSAFLAAFGKGTPPTARLVWATARMMPVIQAVARAAAEGGATKVTVG